GWAVIAKRTLSANGNSIPATHSDTSIILQVRPRSRVHTNRQRTAQTKELLCKITLRHRGIPGSVLRAPVPGPYSIVVEGQVPVLNLYRSAVRSKADSACEE